MVQPSLLWKAPEINPVNNKARSIPILNPINPYGRVFFFAWWGFFIAFWAWYAFPPLISNVIKAELGLSTPQVLNSNIVSLAATLLVRLVAGPLCDRFGPRNTFVGCLIVGSIPGFCSGGIQSASGLYAVRFFVGILGGSFVPCQVWCTAFFDKNTVGFANALAGGWGNAGGGVTYFIMPAIFNSLVGDGLSRDVAWRVTFVFPSLIILVSGIAMLLLCPETPTGPWKDRKNAIDANLRRHSLGGIVDVPGTLNAEKDPEATVGSDEGSDIDKKPVANHDADHFAPGEAHLTTDEMLAAARGETVQKPTFRETMRVILTLQTINMGLCYICSFGAELAINSILGTYYAGQFGLSPQQAGNWAAMFGLLNVVTRPAGGLLSDLVYKATNRSLWAKKLLIHGAGIITAGFLIAIGGLDSKSQSTMFGLVAGMAVFLEAGNGLNFSLVPHVHPHANGVVSGFTGASGNFGGIIFALVFRFVHGYGKAIWVIGIMCMGFNLLTIWVPPIPKGQIGGR